MKKPSLNPKPSNPKPYTPNPKTLNPKTLNPKSLNPQNLQAKLRGPVASARSSSTQSAPATTGSR